MTEPTPTPEAQIAVGNAAIERYNRRLLTLAAVTAALLLLLLGWTLLRVAALAEDTNRGVQAAQVQAEAARVQAAQVAELLQRQKLDDADQQGRIDKAVAAIAVEQRRALVAHDERAVALLRETLGLVGEEVDAPANQETPVVVVRPSPARTFGPATGTAPRPPQTAPRPPAPAPAPAPPPCDQRGKSGKCKR